MSDSEPSDRELSPPPKRSGKKAQRYSEPVDEEEPEIVNGDVAEDDDDTEEEDGDGEAEVYGPARDDDAWIGQSLTRRIVMLLRRFSRT